MKDKWAMCAMGAWLTGTIVVSVVATENFYTIDRLLEQSPNSAFTAVAGRLGSGEARDLLRYLSSELNRLYFQLWNLTQFALGALVFWLLAGNRAAARARWGVASMLALVVLMSVWLTPQIIAVGRSLDFVPRDPPPPALAQFGILHGLYTSLEGIKLLVGAVVTYWIARGADAPRAGVAPI